MNRELSQHIDVMSKMSAKYRNLSLNTIDTSHEALMSQFENLFTNAKNIYLFEFDEEDSAIKKLMPHLKKTRGKLELINKDIVFQKGFKGIWNIPLVERGVIIGEIELQKFIDLKLAKLLTEPGVYENVGSGINQRAVRFIKRKDLTESVFFLIHRELDRGLVFISNESNCKVIMEYFLSSTVISDSFYETLEATTKWYNSTQSS